MFCHARRQDPVQCVMKCHDLHAPGAYPVSRSGMRSGYSIRFLRLLVFGMGCPFDPSPFRSFCRPIVPERRDPDSRVSCAGACARAGARIAAARFARLIARARRRTHLACRLNRGRSAPGRHGREAVRADFASLGPIIPLFPRMQVPNREILLKFQELFVIRLHCPGSRLRGPERIPHQRPGYTLERDACMERAASGNAGGIMAVRAGVSRCRPSCAVRGAGSCRSS